MARLQRRIGNRALSRLGRAQAMPPATATRSNATDDSSRHTTSTDCHSGIAERPDSMLPAIYTACGAAALMWWALVNRAQRIERVLTEIRDLLDVRSDGKLAP